jgi:hypothetical protein
MTIEETDILVDITNRLATVKEWAEIPEETEAGLNGVIDDLNEFIESEKTYSAEQVRLMLASFAPYVRYETKGMNGITWSMIANDWFIKNK